MSREVHVRFCESRGVGFPPAAHLVVLCRSAAQAEQASQRARVLLADLGLELHPDKTRVVDLREGREGFDFLGVIFGHACQGGCGSGIARSATTCTAGRRCVR